MSSHREKRQSRAKAIKKSISAKLALGGACFVLSASAAIGQVQNSEVEPIASQDLTQRLEKLRSSVKNPTAPDSNESQKGARQMAWHNWDNWNKSDWQNIPWSNY